MYEELVDIVDEKDRVIGVMQRSEFVHNIVGHSRIVLAFIKNKEGRLAILRRTADKYYSPLHLAIPGGGVQSGESYEQAIIREIAEEINLCIETSQLRHLGYLSPHEGWCAPGNAQFFKKVYEVEVDCQIDYNPQDFCELLWLFPHEIVARAESDKVATGVLWLVKQYYL